MISNYTMETSSGQNISGDSQPSPLSGAPGIRRPLIISGMILLGLIGGLAGMYTAKNNPAEDPNIQEAHSAAQWVGAGESDAGSPSQQDETPNPTDSSDPIAAPDPEEDVQFEETANRIVKSGKVKSGVPVIKNLTKLGLSTGDAQLIINSLNGIFDFRRSKPGHEFEIHFEKETRQPVYFKYKASLTNIYVSTKTNEKFTARKLNIITDKKQRVFAGTITRSLYGTLSDLGAGPSLAGKVADVLSTQVNFFKEQRPGDTFRIVVDQESLDGKFLGYGPLLALEYNGVRSGKKRLYRFQAGNDNPTYFDSKGVSVPRSVISIPLHYTRMSSPFGYRMHPVLKRKRLHNGTDFAASNGTPVWACAEGRIIIAGKKGANGNLVGIDHGDGLQSYYAHLSRFASGLKVGKTVKRKQVIGFVGSTGRSTGPHLHWGLKKNGKFVDPLKYKIRPGRPVNGKYRKTLMALIRKYGKVMDNTKIQAPKGELAKVEDQDYDHTLGDEDDF